MLVWQAFWEAKGRRPVPFGVAACIIATLYLTSSFSVFLPSRKKL
jgi:hypothetical protein